MGVEIPDFIDERILMLGSRQVTSYLVMGERYAWIGGGTAWGVPRLEEQLDRFRVDRNRIRYLVVSHVHHDHCGAVPYLCRKYPWIEVVASTYGAHLLTREKPVRLMKELNARTLDRLEMAHMHDGIPLEFSDIHVAHHMGDGDRLHLGGGLSLQFYDTPGHSRCSMSVYLPERKILFPGDSLPYPERGRNELTVTANHDYPDYLSSLEKLRSLSIDMVAYEHCGILDGNDAREIVSRALDASLKQRERIRTRLRELGDAELLVDETVAKYQTVELFRLLSIDVLKPIIRRMVLSAIDER
jgi:2-aminobenzoylacetyl-CoA thioesterase